MKEKWDKFKISIIFKEILGQYKYPLSINHPTQRQTFDFARYVQAFQLRREKNFGEFRDSSGTRNPGKSIVDRINKWSSRSDTTEFSRQRDSSKGEKKKEEERLGPSPGGAGRGKKAENLLGIKAFFRAQAPEATDWPPYFQLPEPGAVLSRLSR